MPLISSRWAGATLGISYRRIIVRNIVCAAGITAAITARMVVVNLLMVNNRYVEFVVSSDEDARRPQRVLDDVYWCVCQEHCETWPVAQLMSI